MKVRLLFSIFITRNTVRRLVKRVYVMSRWLLVLPKSTVGRPYVVAS